MAVYNGFKIHDESKGLWMMKPIYNTSIDSKNPAIHIEFNRGLKGLNASVSRNFNRTGIVQSYGPTPASSLYLAETERGSGTRPGTSKAVAPHSPLRFGTVIQTAEGRNRTGIDLKHTGIFVGIRNDPIKGSIGMIVDNLGNVHSVPVGHQHEITPVWRRNPSFQLPIMQYRISDYGKVFKQGNSR
jgi:hypothetical protein